MEKFIVATGNSGKIAEIKRILKDLPFKVVTMSDAGFEGDIEETGSTFEENALIKAEAVHSRTGGYVMADDSGLMVDYLNGMPGVFSSRFAGETADDNERNRRILELMEGVPFSSRNAKFVCAIAVVNPDGSHFIVKDICEGYIGTEKKGSNGFGYDPVFYMPEYGKTTAEMSPDEKNAVSHRGKALKKMIFELKRKVMENAKD